MSKLPSASVNLGISSIPDVDNQEIYQALLPVHSAIRNVMYALDAYTGNLLITPDEYSQINATGQIQLQKTAVFYVKLTEAVAVGNMINIWNSGGARGRKSVSATQRIHGYALASGAIGDTIPICLFGLCSLIGGLTPGADYYASTTPGQITASVTSQRIGFALDATHLWFTP